MADLTVKQNDIGALLTGTFVDASGAPINLAGAAVTCVLRPVGALAPTTSATAAVVNAAAGTVSYTLTAADTVTAGLYAGEFYAIVSSNRYSCPTAGYLELSVEENLSTAGGQRLVGISEVKDYLNISSTNRGNDAELIRFIDAMTPIIEGVTGPIVPRQINNEIYSGGSETIALRSQPVLSVSSVVEYWGDQVYPLTQVPNASAGETYSYMVEPPNRIVRRSDGGAAIAFAPGYGSVVVSYVAGFAVTPPNVREATLELIRINYQRTQQSSRPAFGGGSAGGDENLGNNAAMGFFVPNRVREMLAPNRRYPRIA